MHTHRYMVSQEQPRHTQCLTPCSHTNLHQHCLHPKWNIEMAYRRSSVIYPGSSSQDSHNIHRTNRNSNETVQGKYCHTDTSPYTSTSTQHTDKRRAITDCKDQINMGCTSSRSASHTTHRPRGHRPHEEPHVPFYGNTHASPHYKPSYANTTELPRPPPSAARGRARDRYAPRASYDPYDSPYSQRNYTEGNGKYYAQIHLQNQPVREPHVPTRRISLPRHRNEMPRRNPSYRYRDVSPLGTSRFEQPFERPAWARTREGSGRVAVEATFRNGDIGGWENY